MTDKTKEALKLALEGAANYIDALGGDSRKYRQALAEQPAIPTVITCPFCSSEHVPGWLHDYNMDRGAYGKQPAQQQEAWAETAMRLAADLSIESLRLGSYERKDTYENAGRASWQTIEIREKREAARERLRQHVYTSPPAQPAQREWIGGNPFRKELI